MFARAAACGAILDSTDPSLSGVLWMCGVHAVHDGIDKSKVRVAETQAHDLLSVAASMGHG